MATTINNSANIRYTHGTLSDTAISNIATTLLAENYSLSAEKTSYNTNWRPSENLTYILRIENDGAEPLYGVTIQDNLGGNTTRLLNYIAGSARMIRGEIITGITPSSVAPLTMEVPGTLEPGEVVIFSYVAKVVGDISNEITGITNEVTVTGHEVSVSGPVVNVTPVPSLTLPKANYAQVAIEKIVDKENVSVGETLTYTFRLENSGNIEATNVVITDNLPTNFTIQSIVSETNGVQTTFDPTDYSIDVDNKLTLPTSATKTISVPASTTSGTGVTIVTIAGTITA